MQVGDLVGVLVAGFVMFGVLIILNQGDINMGLVKGYQGGFGSPNLSAPQAGLMATLAQGIVGGEMTWGLIIAGMILGVAFILMGIKSPMLIFVGMYLPFSTVFAIFVGGLIKGMLDLVTAKRKYNERRLSIAENTGVLLASGLIAGEALMGLVVAVFAMFNIFLSNILPIENPWYLIGLVIVGALGYCFVRIPLKKADAELS
jgi:uncharacterized oligopeptide transporter (OPT) family protein